MKIFRLGAACFLLTLSGFFGATTTAWAADEKGEFAVRGIGGMRCSEVLAKVAANAPELVPIVAWSDGALTMYNNLMRDTYDAMPFTEPPGIFTEFVVRYCQKNPDALYANAVRQALDIVDPSRLRHAEARVVVKVDDKSVSIAPETLRRVQEQLIKLKLLSGKPAPTFNDKVRNALRTFQKNQHIPETGLPDAETSMRLLLLK